MNYLLDTDICSAHLRDASSVSKYLLQYSGRLAISVISLGELYSWTLRKSCPPKYHDGLMDLLSDVVVLDLDHAIAREFGEVRGQLMGQGRSIPTMDLFVAATALVHDLTLVTHNTRHFVGIPRLMVADWLAQ